MKYQRYKYTEDDISTLVESALRKMKSCAQVYKDGKWPFSINVLNGYLVGRRAAGTERLKTAIKEYKGSYARYSALKKISDTKITEITMLRTEGLSLSEISKMVDIAPPAVGYVVSGKCKHPLAPNKKISGKKGPGAPKKIKPPKPPKPPNPTKPKRITTKEVINRLTNAIGSPHFDPDQVIEMLTKEADRIRQEGGDPGSLIALANILPEITEEAKKRY